MSLFTHKLLKFITVLDHLGIGHSAVGNLGFRN